MPRSNGPGPRRGESSVAKEIREAGRAVVEPSLARLAEDVASGIEPVALKAQWDELGLVLLGLGRVDVAVDAFLRSLGLDARIACQLEHDDGELGSATDEDEESTTTLDESGSNSKDLVVARDDAAQEGAALKETPPASNAKVLIAKAGAAKRSPARERRAASDKNRAGKAATGTKKEPVSKKSRAGKAATGAKKEPVSKKSRAGKAAAGTKRKSKATSVRRSSSR